MQIKTHEKGCYGKYLHRLIFEDFYQTEIPDDWVIHHDDHNPLNNEIWNLIPMTKAEHTALHSRGNTWSRRNSNKCRKIYYRRTKKSRKSNTWSRRKYVSEETRLKQSKAHTGKIIPISARANRSKVTTTTGFLRVYTKKAKTTKQGFIWCYQYQDKNKKHNWSSVNLKKLKEKVLKKGLEWFIVDEPKAKQICDEYGYDYEELC